MLKPQDILTLLKIRLRNEPNWQQKTLAAELALSPAELHMSLKRCAAAQLFAPDTREVALKPFLGLLVHGVPYFLPTSLGRLTRGVPTAWGAPPLCNESGEVEKLGPVWPYPEGNTEGQAVEPLYRTAVQAAVQDAGLYTDLALIDALRVGEHDKRARAARHLRRRFGL